MRVAHILRKYVPAEWGGTETALQRLTEGLAAQGVTNAVYYPGTAAPVADDPLTAAGCELHPYQACVPVWGLPEATRRQMLAVGGNILSFDLPWLLSRDRDLDVIHSHVLGRIGGIAGTIARRRNLPLVISIHGGVLDMPAGLRQNLETTTNHRGLEWGRLFGWWWRARHLLAEADAILTCNLREAMLLREQHPQQRVIVQPHGVNTALFRPDHRDAALNAFPRIKGRDVLLIMARIDPVKNQQWVVKQLPAVVARHPNVLLVLAGSCTNAEYGAALQRDIRDLGLENHVLLTGGLVPGVPATVGLMQTATIAILPSLSETFGLVVLESWAAGAAALASNTTGAMALVRDGENGGLFDLARPEEFHARLDRLLTDPAWRTSLIEAGHRGAADYDTGVLAGRVHDLYAQLSDEKNALRHSA
jgi:starch synthase